MTTEPVTVQGRYRLGRLLGAGGMGRVWLARDQTLDRDVAVKEILLPDELLEADREALRRHMLREGRASARLSHPNVARVYDAFESAGRAWIIMEYVPSRSLQEVISQDGPLPPERAARVGLEVLAALTTAHAAGVRHRDVKPANVLIGHDGRVVLTDFGVAAVDGESISTSSGLVVGSPQYMSPERIRDGEAHAAGDLWSLGATLYAAVEGRPPYQRASVMETITAIAADEPEPPHRAGPLRPTLDGLLRKDPAERIDAAEAERRLSAALAEGSAAVSSTIPEEPEPSAPAEGPAAGDDPAPGSPPLPKAQRPEAAQPPGRAPSADGRRRRVWLTAAACALVVLVAGVVWAVLRPDDRASNSRAQPSAAPAATPPTPSSDPSEPSGSSGAGSGSSGSGSSGSAGPSSPATSAPVSATATGRSRPPLPGGWIDHRDPTGFSVYVPEGWSRSKEGSIVYFRSKGRVLGIDQTREPQWNPVADWRGKATYRVRRGDFPRYDEVHIREVDYFLKAADWEFTFTRSH
ncbi:protein kinase, partial [Actinoplanes sp. NPDC051633]|uniref:serine/threonine-protein kinase n=1 Tax=Actinoplanes sp. NPDC051633 TaxID=3155670 RepID=UPI003418F878